jgi:hypothetical protein
MARLRRRLITTASKLAKKATSEVILLTVLTGVLENEQDIRCLPAGTETTICPSEEISIGAGFPSSWQFQPG